MKKLVLYMTEHLSKLMSAGQLQCVERACLSSGYDFVSNFSDYSSFCKIKEPNVLLASEHCLAAALIVCQNFIPKSNFILFGSHKVQLQFEKFKDQLQDLRFVLGDPPISLLELILTHTLNFFKDNKQTESISGYFTQENSFYLSCELRNSKEREDLRNKISVFFKTQIENNKDNLTTGASVYAKNLADVLEEFLMNAIWDANPKYVGEDRTKPVQLLENEKVNIFCLFDGINLILSVTDLFGSFSAKAIQKYIQFSLGVKEEKTVHEGNGGAGIGLFMILQKIGGLVFEVEKGKATRATAIVRGDQPLREMQKRSRTLLFYEK
ncbi:MAG: hypothetical protein V4591_07090 [Bdellovibrionota bacterium]